jgi:hypothetical protein
LKNLSLNDENQVRIATEGGLVHIFAAMVRHVDVAGVQERCCGALWNLSFNASNIVAIKAAGGLELLQAAIRAHSSQAYIVRRANDVIRRLLKPR